MLKFEIKLDNFYLIAKYVNLNSIFIYLIFRSRSNLPILSCEYESMKYKFKTKGEVT